MFIYICTGIHINKQNREFKSFVLYQRNDDVNSNIDDPSRINRTILC